MQRTLSFRRHQDWKHKKEALRKLKMFNFYQYNNPYYYGLDRLFVPPIADKKAIGLLATTPKRCGKWCCSNRRDIEGVTLKEKINILNTLDEIEELGYNITVIKKL